MTWQKFMTYAHKNIELRPIPFIENPLPGKTEEPKQEVVEADETLETQPLRPKLLSKKSEETLRNLEQIFQNAKPLQLNGDIADFQDSSVVTQ